MNYVYPTSSYLNFFPMVQVEPKKYFLDLSTSSEGSLVILDESETFIRSTRFISTRCQKIRRKFHKHMDLFLTEGGSSSYDHEEIGDIEVPLRYKHILKQWVNQGYSSTKHIFLCEWEDISNCTIVITWFGVVLDGWHKGQLRQMYRIDWVCWTLLQLQRLVAPSPIYMRYA